MTRFQTVSNRRVSLWQSAVAETIRQTLIREERLSEQELKQSILTHPMMKAVTRHATQLLHSKKLKKPRKKAPEEEKTAYLSYLMHLRAEAKGAKKLKQQVRLEEKIRKFSSFDKKGWMSSTTTYLKYLFTLGSPYYRDWNDYGKIDEFGVIQYKLPNDAKVALISDWGTGMPDAKSLLQSILVEHKPDAVIHLGDIYYSGTPEECQNHFVQVFEDLFSSPEIKRIPVFCIPGNHEYYSFGDGFYHEVLDVMNQSKSSWNQQASYFCLRTRDNKWQLLGMDTGRHDENPNKSKSQSTRLQETEIQWHYDKLQHYQGSTVLLSHHPLFSQHSLIQNKTKRTWLNEHLMKTFSPYFNKISAWYWGHEHNLILFHDGIMGLKKGRLIGCSAFEVMARQNPYKEYNKKHLKHVPYKNDMPRLSVEDGYYYHAYAILDFSVRTTECNDIQCSYYEFPSWGCEKTNQNVGSKKIFEENIESI